MQPVNDTAQDHALEALIAASLRAPGKQPQASDDDLKRFVEQQVTLSAEDEAALNKAKPALKSKLLAALGRGQRQTSTKKVEIPKSLLTLGEKKGLIPSQMQTLLNMRLQVIGHRCDSPTDDLEFFDWERFYEKVKEYIK